MSVVMMKKSLPAVPGPALAMAMVQALLLKPVWLVGSCAIAGNCLPALRAPPWMMPPSPYLKAR